MSPWIGVLLFWAGALAGYAVCLVILARRVNQAKERLEFATSSYIRATKRIGDSFNGVLKDLEEQAKG